MHVAVVLFDDFETLDVFGPVEIFGRLRDHYQVKFYSLNGGLISNNHGVSIPTKHLSEIINGTDILLMPGGFGTRREVDNRELINCIKVLSEKSQYVLSVCTGSALLAKTGLLNGRSATSNKRAFKWAVSQGKDVNWQYKSRWTVDGKFYTSSGVSAGMDMTLGFLEDLHGYDFAKKVAVEIEYNWIEEKDQDPFAQENDAI